MVKSFLPVFIFLLSKCLPCVAQEINTAGMELVTVKQGKFLMGSAGYGENYDEKPAHAVRISGLFRMSATEVTNKQYELFDPGHHTWRGKRGFSTGDDEAVVFVSYYEAAAFCKWLSQKEGKTYRLPTEAEWEYACRAGTFTDFATGTELPKAYQKNQETVWTPKPVSLKVAQTAANSWGLYDMHGNVEEWCADWYGPYSSAAQTDPAGGGSGLYKITRGGSHSTPVRYLRSANRLAMIPEDKSWLVGFRVVQAEFLSVPSAARPPAMQPVRQSVYTWVKQNKPVFMEPVPYVQDPACGSGIPVYAHNHCPAVTWCTNGDMLAVWFSTNEEAGREMMILGSRLRAGSAGWDAPAIFFKVPDRNMTGSSLYRDQDGTLFYMNGVEAAGSWQNLAMVLRTSKDNGATWSAPLLADTGHAQRNQVIAGMFKSREGWLLQAADATPAGEGGTALHISKDAGASWYNPYLGAGTPEFKEGKTGGLIAGIHAGLVQLKSGELMALGRGNSIPGNGEQGLRMPLSISADMGKTWTYHASEFPPISGGQRLVLRRLNEGAIIMLSFTHHPSEKDSSRTGMFFTAKDGSTYKGSGLFAAISFDEGKTWPVKKLITDGRSRFLNGGAWTGYFETDKTHAEPRGYLAMTQTPDNMIHLLSSAVHYRFNLQWLMQPG